MDIAELIVKLALDREDEQMAKPAPTIIRGPAGQEFMITLTEHGLSINIGEGFRLVYTSIISDGNKHLRFEIEPTTGKRKIK